MSHTKVELTEERVEDDVASHHSDDHDNRHIDDSQSVSEHGEDTRAELQNQIEELTNKLEALHKNHESSIARQEQEVELMADRVAEQHEEFRKLLLNKTEIQTQLSDLQKLINIGHEKLMENQQAKKELPALEQKLLELNAEKEALESQLSDLATERSSSDDALAKLKEDLQTTQTLVQTSERQLTDLIKQRVALNSPEVELAPPAVENAPVVQEKVEQNSEQEGKKEEKATETAANDEANTAKEEEKKTVKQKMYSFMIAFFAHPVTKAACVLVFTAGLLALGVAMTSIVNLAVVCVVATLGLFASGLVYHRAQLSKNKEADKVAAPEANKPADEAKNDDTAKNSEVEEEIEEEKVALAI